MQKTDTITEKTVAAESPVINETTDEKKDEFIPTKIEKLSGPNVVGKIDLQQFSPKKTDDGGEEGRKNVNALKRQKS